MREEVEEKENSIAVELHSEFHPKAKATAEEEEDLKDYVVEEADEVKYEQLEAEVEWDPNEGEKKKKENKEDTKHVSSRAIVKCPTCAKEYCSSGYLKKHVKAVHLKLKPFKCLKCGCSFAENKKLKRHVDAVHKKLRPFGCTVCEKSFALKEVLKGHVEAVHQKLKPLGCTVCEKRFSDNTTLKRHTKTVHQKLRPLHCAVCRALLQSGD